VPPPPRALRLMKSPLRREPVLADLIEENVIHGLTIDRHIEGSREQGAFAVPPSRELGGMEIPLETEARRNQSMAFGAETRRAGLAPVAGWHISDHHRYDPRSRTLFMGDGWQRTASAIGEVVDTVAGHGGTPIESTPVPAGDAQLSEPVRAVAAAGDGSIYLADGAGILRLSGGVVTRIVTFDAGTGNVDFRPGIAARGDRVVSVFGDIQGDCGEGGQYTTLRVRRLTPSGLGEELAIVATDPLWFTPCSGGTRVAIGTDGSISVGAGTDTWLIPPGGTAVHIDRFPSGVASLAAGPGGSVYLGGALQVRQWRPNAPVRIIAGNGTEGNEGDGGPALDAQLGDLGAMVVDPDGNVLIASRELFSSATRIRVVRPNGIIEWYAGTDEGFGSISNGSPGRSAALGFIRGLALTPDGTLYVTTINSSFTSRLMRLRLPFDGSRVPSSDGALVYEFDLAGRHLRTVDSLTGITSLTFAYDTAGRLTAITDRDGLQTHINRDSTGTPLSIVSPFGVTTTLTVGASGYLESVADAEGGATTLGYGTGGLLTSLEDANAGVYTFNYDAVGRLLIDADPAGGTQDLARSELPNGWAVTRDVTDGGVTTYITEQGANGIQTRRVSAADGTESVSVSGGNGTTIIVEPGGTETTATQSPDPRFGMAAPVVSTTTVRTPANLTLTLAQARTVVLSDPNNPLSVVSHTDTTTLNGRETRTVFDAAARTVTTTSPANRQMVTTLDALGRPSSLQVGTSMLPITFTYDAAGRFASQTQGSRTTTLGYDAQGYVSSVTDPLNRTFQFENDGIGRRVQQTFPDLRETVFVYDDNNNVTSLTPPGRPAHTMTYTPANLLESYTAPLIGPPMATQYQFNLAKQLTMVTRADGQQFSWARDPVIGRLTQVSTPTGNTTYGYSSSTGQLTSVTAPNVTLTYTYDGSLQTSETFSGAVAGRIDWNYDNFFRVVAERVRDAHEVTFGYDDDGLLLQAGAITYERNAENGSLTRSALGPIATIFGYNNVGELTSVSTTYGANAFSATYGRDAVGRVETKTETVNGVTTTDHFGYDLAGRLETVTRGGSLVASYVYDPNGNRTGITTPVGTTTATYDSQDRILTLGSRTYTHTPHGDVASWTENGATTTLTYDVQGNLLQVVLPSGDVISYIVDGRNRRVGKNINGVRVQGWLYGDQLRPLAELDASGNIVARFVYGTRLNLPEYVIRSDGTYRIVSDQLGSPRVIVNAGTGAAIQHLEFDAFGEIVQDSNSGWQPFGFAGGLYDPHTGLLRFGTRDYDPKLGRFLAKDPIRFNGGSTNLYEYVSNDPINWIDPTGLQKTDPPPNIPGGPWQWSPDASNARGGTYIGPDGHRASWDPEGHWDVANPPSAGGGRNHFDPRGNPITATQAHNPPRSKMQPIDYSKRFKGPRGIKGLGKGLGVMGFISTIIEACEMAAQEQLCSKNPCACGDWARCPA